jgi:hypothetical protein
VGEMDSKAYLRHTFLHYYILFFCLFLPPRLTLDFCFLFLRAHFCLPASLPLPLGRTYFECGGDGLEGLSAPHLSTLLLHDLYVLPNVLCLRVHLPHIRNTSDPMSSLIDFCLTFLPLSFYFLLIGRERGRGREAGRQK